MIITDHRPKWLINKAEARQIIYLYGSVDTKFRVNSLEWMRVLGHQVMDGRARIRWKPDPLNTFSGSYCVSCPVTFVFAFLPKCEPQLEASRRDASSTTTVRYMNTNVWLAQFCKIQCLKKCTHVNCTCPCKTNESKRTLKWWDKPLWGQRKPCQDISLWHSPHKSHKDS